MLSQRLAAVAAVAAVAAGGAIVASSSGSDSGSTRPTTHAPAGLLAGIPEHRGVLGAPDAPLTLTEFVDPQCPICAAASRQVLPSLIARYVRTGRVRLDARVLHFIGPDSTAAARYAAGARAQDRLWAFLETLYANQGAENSDYVTPRFLSDVARLAGVDPGAAARAAGTAEAGRALRTADAEAARLGVTGTPTFVLRTHGGHGRIVPVAQLDAVLGS